ncbi:polyprenol reductase [[Candida] railenensis]|uniref:Polyprenal reductase n=1 Tax=[Candida] railenensis TaxID=45579 RepID=A0A9P0QP62_9ASCO|nr:polyprenol reductase [[Candida] railenensis]
MTLLLSIGAILTVKVVPSLNVLLLYGKTAKQVKKKDSYVNQIAHLTVPKSWFLHFYIVYFGILSIGGAIVYLSSGQNCSVFVAYNMLLVQSFRRLLESLYITKFNPSAKINISHYLAGMIFYTTISINTFLGILREELAHSSESASVLTYFLSFLYVCASLDQYYNHRYLSKLVKYTVPTRGLFSILAAPHYFDEVVIYLVVALLAHMECSAPLSITEGNFWLSATFVLTNLSISALESNKYYEKTNNKKPWAIIPGLL